MMTQEERLAAADVLEKAERDRVQATQLSITWPHIDFDDAYAISAEGARRKVANGARIIGHKVGLTSKAMQRSSIARSASRVISPFCAFRRACFSASGRSRLPTWSAR